MVCNRLHPPDETRCESRRVFADALTDNLFFSADAEVQAIYLPPEATTDSTEPKGFLAFRERCLDLPDTHFLLSCFDLLFEKQGVGQPFVVDGFDAEEGADESLVPGNLRLTQVG